MKKIVLFLAALVTTSICVTSCLKDSDISANINYYATADSIKPLDTSAKIDTMWQNRIIESLYKLQVTQTVINEDTTLTTGNAQYAAYICNDKAINDYSYKLRQLSLTKIKNSIFANHSSEMKALGYPTADEIPLNPFYLYTTLHSGMLTTSSDSIRTFCTKID